MDTTYASEAASYFAFLKQFKKLATAAAELITLFIIKFNLPTHNVQTIPFFENFDVFFAFSEHSCKEAFK